MKRILILLILILPFFAQSQTCTGIDNPNTLGIDNTDCATFEDLYHGEKYTWNGGSWDLAEAVLCDDITYVSGNVVISGTIDGYDISVMGVKLAGIPSNATAPQALSSVISVGDAGGEKVENIGNADSNDDAVSLGQMLDSLSRSCAEMYITSASPQVLAITSGAYSKIIGHSTDVSFLVGFTYAAGTFTKTSTGTQEYYITASVSGSFGTGNTVIEANVFVNNAVVGKIAYTRKIGTGGDVGSAALSGLLSLTLNDTIDVRLKADNTNNWTTENLNFSVIQAN